MAENKWLNPLNSRLDADQTLIRAYDEDKNRHRVDAEVSAVISSVDVIIDASSDNIAIRDNEGDELEINSDGSINVIVQDITLEHENDSVEVFQADHDNLNANANVQQNNTDVSVSNPLYTQTTNGALETTQGQVLSELQSANTSLDNIEADTDLIRIATQSIDSDIDVQLSTRASEATQLLVRAELQAANTSLDNIESDADVIRLQAIDINSELDTQTSILTNIKSDTAQIITELQASNTSLDNIESDADAIRLAVESIDADFDVALSTRATEATQIQNRTELQSINSELDSQTILLTNIDQSTNDIETAVESLDTKFDVNLSTRNAEATQQLVLTELQSLNTSTDNIESDIDLIRIATQSIDTDFDVALSTRASESTLQSAVTELQSANTSLDNIEADAESIRVETVAINAELETHTLILTEIENDTDAIISELQSANTSLDNIESDADAIRIATQSIDTDIDVALSTRASEVTQAAVLVELQSLNTSTDNIESDTDLIRIAVQSIDTDFDVALSTRATEATQLNVYGELQTIDDSLNDIEARLETFDTNVGATTANTLRTSSNLTDEAGAAFTDTNYLPVGQTVADRHQVEIHGNFDDSTDRTVLLGNNGEVRTLPKGFEEAGNSTTTPLGISGIFTGTWIKVTDYAVVTFTIFSDVASATNGLSVQWSPDGINIDRTENSDLNAGSGRAFALNVRGRYFRIVYTNGTSAQTTFRIATDLHTEGCGIITRPLSQTITDSNFAQLVTSVITGKNTTGQYVPHRSNSVSAIGQNSTITPLGVSGTFTGQWEDVLGFANIGVTVFTDQSSTTNGLILEYSTDGVNVDDNDFYTVSANNGSTNTVGVTYRYFRVRYINGTTLQTAFRLSTVYSITAQKPSSHRIDDSINGQNDAELSKAVLTGKNPDSDFTNVRVQGISTVNSSDTPLAAGGIFRGIWFNWQASYIQLLIDVTSDVAGTMFIDFSQEPVPIDGSEVSLSGDPIERPYDPVLSPLYKIHVPVQSRWVRVRYINGPAGQTRFNLDSAFTTTQSGSYASSLFGLPDPNTLVPVIRSVLTVPDATGNGYQNFPVSSAGNPKISVEEVHSAITIDPLDTPVFSQAVVGTSASRIDMDTPSNRRTFIVTNEGPGRAAIGTNPLLSFNTQSNRLPVGRSISLVIPASINMYGIAETTGGSQTTLQRSPASASGTATNPNNTISNNATYANFTAAAQTITATGYTAGTTNTLVSVKLGIDGNKQSGQTETVAVSEFQSGSTAGAGTVVSASLAGGSNQLYIAIVTRNDASGTVNTVAGGGMTFTATSQINIANGNRRMDAWFAYGTFTAGAITATLSTSTNAHIAVYRITNADPTTPIQTINNSTGSGTAVTGPAIAGTNNGLAILAISHAANSGTPGAGYTENIDFTNDSGSKIDSLITANKPLVATGSETGTYTLVSNAAWAAIGITVLPSPAINPVITLSYTLSAVPGITSGTVTLSSSSDVSSTVDVTADRAWVVADIPNVNVIATATTISAAQANIDWLYLELVDTTGNTARLSIYQAGKTVI